MSSLAKRGPKTTEGRLAVRLNASKHGILSPRPVVSHFESEKSWRTHREAILDSLAPEGGIEQALAERVALCSWRLNRVVVYETETISAGQEAVIEEVRGDRAHKLKHAILYRAEVREMVRGTYLADAVEEILDSGAGLSDRAVELFSPPENELERVERTRALYEAFGAVSDADKVPDAVISRDEALSLLEKGCYHAAEYAALEVDGDEVRAGDPEEIRARARILENGIFEEMPDGEAKGTFTAAEMRDYLQRCALEAGVPEEFDYTPLEALLEKLNVVLLRDLDVTRAAAETVEKALKSKRRNRILPKEQDLEKIRRYEAHLSRQMYQALHELEALQERRSGGKVPLARLDVQGIE